MSNLFEFREQLNITQEELSQESGISVRTIQRIEAGTNPKGHTLKSLAKALEISENQLLNKQETTENIDYKALKLINISSLLFVFIPLVNILPPLIIMWLKKQRNPLSKQLISLQILWSFLMVVLFLIGTLLHRWFSISNDLIVSLLILAMLGNVFIILRNTVEIDKNKKLHIYLKFSLI